MSKLAFAAGCSLFVIATGCATTGGPSPQSTEGSGGEEPSSSSSSGCVVSVLVGKASGDPHSVSANVKGDVSSVNDKSIAHFDGDKVIVEGSFGTSTLGTVHDDHAVVGQEDGLNIKSTPFTDGTTSFDLKDRGVYEAKGTSSCTNRQLGLGAVHVVALIVDRLRPKH